MASLVQAALWSEVRRNGVFSNSVKCVPGGVGLVPEFGFNRGEQSKLETLPTLILAEYGTHLRDMLVGSGDPVMDFL